MVNPMEYTAKHMEALSIFVRMDTTVAIPPTNIKEDIKDEMDNLIENGCVKKGYVETDSTDVKTVYSITPKGLRKYNSIMKFTNRKLR